MFGISKRSNVYLRKILTLVRFHTSANRIRTRNHPWAVQLRVRIGITLTEEEIKTVEHLEDKTRVFAGSALAFAFLQSVCTALIAASGMRFALGFAALLSSVALSSPAQKLYSEVIRLPMLAVALAGAGINLLVLWQVRRLRRRPASSWRIKPLSARKR